MNRKKINAQATKSRILKSALQLFAEKGYKQATVDEIVARANSSKGAFYNHFASKDMLIYENIRYKDALYAEWSQEMSRLDTAADQLRYFAEHLFQVNSAGPELSPLLLTMEIGSAQISDQYLNRERYLYKLLIPIFRDALASGEFQSDLNADQLTDYFLTVTTGVTCQWCIQKCTFDIVAFGRTLVDIFLQGLAAVGQEGVPTTQDGTDRC